MKGSALLDWAHNPEPRQLRIQGCGSSKQANTPGVGFGSFATAHQNKYLALGGCAA